MKTENHADKNFEILSKMFPNAVTETINDSGEVVRAIDADVLRQEISVQVVEGKDERYQFTWPDKRKAIVLANTPISETLRLDKSKSVGKDGIVGEVTSKNIYIEGDNLDALKLLRETYLEKINVIYIDPPYNTGSDFIYADDFSMEENAYVKGSGQVDEEGNRLVQNMESNGRFHTDWLNMLLPRLRIAKDLLTEDGIIFISIDDNEYDNLKKLCDEIFGVRNFVANIVWQSTAGSNTGTNVITVTENILLYAKNSTICKFNTLPIEDDEKYSNRDEYFEKRGGYVLNKLDRRMTGPHYSEALNYPITMPDGTTVYPGSTTSKNNENWNYRWSQQKVEWGIKNGFIVFKQVDGKWNAYFKQYLKVDNNDQPIDRSLPYQNLIKLDQFNTTQGTREIMNLLGNKHFDYAKPSGLIKYLINMFPQKDIRVLDFFSGSATTAHAIMAVNAEDGGSREYILVQLPEKTDELSEPYKDGYKTICDIGEERIRRAGKKIKEETGTDIDYGFRVFRIDSSNMKDVYYNPADTQQTMLDVFSDNIKEDRTPEDLLFQVMLELGVMLSSKIEETEIAGKKVFDVAEGFLIACFDKDITDETVKAIAQKKPYYAVFRDSSMANDSVATNFDQIFETYSPDTVRKVL